MIEPLTRHQQLAVLVDLSQALTDAKFGDELDRLRDAHLERDDHLDQRPRDEASFQSDLAASCKRWGLDFPRLTNRVREHLLHRLPDESLPGRLRGRMGDVVLFPEAEPWELLGAVATELMPADRFIDLGRPDKTGSAWWTPIVADSPRSEFMERMGAFWDTVVLPTQQESQWFRVQGQPNSDQAQRVREYVAWRLARSRTVELPAKPWVMRFPSRAARAAATYMNIWMPDVLEACANDEERLRRRQEIEAGLENREEHMRGLLRQLDTSL